MAGEKQSPSQQLHHSASTNGAAVFYTGEVERSCLLCRHELTENKPPNYGNIVESDEKQVTTPDPRWPYLNRWSSNPGIDVSTQAASELAPPHPRIVTTVEGDSCAAPLEAGSGSELVSPHPPDVPTVEVGSNASLIENAEEVTTDSTILATPAISDKEKAELSSAGSPSLPPELNVSSQLAYEIFIDDVDRFKFKKAT
ncbi:hypothetical protein YC2023_009083 [Brassica napus]